MANATIKDVDLGMAGLLREFQSIKDNANHVDIGIQSDESEQLIIIAAANEFGAEINHPGGTSYGYRTKKDASSGKVSFLKRGKGYMEIGVTKPHKIIIPARSYIRSTVDENEDKYFKDSESLSKQMLDQKIDKHQALTLMGQTIEADIKNKIISVKEPPNAPSTIRKKGSANPLVNKGLLGQSIRYAVNK